MEIFFHIPNATGIISQYNKLLNRNLLQEVANHLIYPALLRSSQNFIIPKGLKYRLFTDFYGDNTLRRENAKPLLWV